MKHAVTLLLAAALSACASLPGPQPAPGIRPQSAWASGQSFSGPAGEWPSAGWWKAYGDPQLDALIEEGLAGSPSVAAADARLERGEREGVAIAPDDDLAIEHGAVWESSCGGSDLGKAVGDELLAPRPQEHVTGAHDELRPDPIPLPFGEEFGRVA